jgi:D-alanyl-D-alanine carboxypeptidase
MPLQLINLFLNKSFTNLNLKKLLLLFFLSIFFIFQNYLADAKYASIIMNENTGKIYYQKNASTMNYPASLTKIMTLYMIFDSLKSKKITMKTKFKVSKNAAIKPPSKLGLHPGSTISVRNAILALITKSANDVASVVAENLGKTEKRFAKKMTAMAKKIGMKRTVFRNASGLPNKGQLSTARDMAKLAILIRKNFPEYFHFFKRKTFTYNNIEYRNHNNLLGSYDGTDGIKTGYTNASGFNLVASVERNGQRIIGVVFGGKTARTRDRHMIHLLNKYFLTKANQPLVRTAKSYELPTNRPKIIVEKRTVSSQKNNFVNQKSSVTEDWFIQIGAFSNKLNAHKAARKARNAAPEQLGNLPASLRRIPFVTEKNSKKSLWRVRFVELAENQARSVCAELWASGLGCIPLPSK